jgi:hypothetical protein
MQDNLLDGSDIPTPKPLKKVNYDEADTENEDSQIEIDDDEFETPRALKLKSRTLQSRVIISTDEEHEVELGYQTMENSDPEADSDNLSDLGPELQKLIQKIRMERTHKAAGGKKAKRDKRAFRTEVQGQRAVVANQEVNKKSKVTWISPVLTSIDYH